MSKNQLTGTATQPQCNRKFCQFNNDQYCKFKAVLIHYMYNTYSIFGESLDPDETLIH